MKLRMLTIVASAALLLGGSAGGAAAHKAKFKSIVEIDSYLLAGSFGGTVGSFENKRCSANRVVTVWKRNPGAMDGPLGTARSGKGGVWTLAVTAPTGNYYATVKPRKLPSSKKHKHVCRFDRSSNFGIR